LRAEWHEGDACVYEGRHYVIVRVLIERGEAMLRDAEGGLHFGVPLRELRTRDER
jgi:hypothetical protein